MPESIWRDRVESEWQQDIESLLDHFGTSVDLAVAHAILHCYRQRPPVNLIRLSVMRWMEDYDREDIVAAAYITGQASPNSPMPYMSAVLKRWKEGGPRQAVARQAATDACTHCGGELDIDHARYMNKPYCSTCYDGRAWRNQ